MCLPHKPFKIEKEWIHKGLSCAVTLAREGQHRCGYVRVPPGHPLHGAEYGSGAIDSLRAHGGVNFAEVEPCTEHEDGQGWWLGFDFAHAFDSHWDPELDPEKLSPETREAYNVFRKYPLLLSRGLHYWTLPEAEAECEQLADQLAEVRA